MKTVEIVLDIKHLAAEGLNKSQIARRLGIDRGTVARYLNLTEVPERITRKPVPRKIDDYMGHIKARLARYPELTAKRLYREIVKLGYTGSYRTVRRHVNLIRPRPAQRDYKPFETLPGEQAQVDWGTEGEFEWDGRKYKVYSFNFILGYSRTRYVEYTISQDLATFLSCLERALRYVGGSPAEIVFDNCKTVVSERLGTVIRFQADLLRLALTFKFNPKACWVNDPESKGKVEKLVDYARRDFFYGTEFSSLADVNRQARVWLEEIANSQVSQATGRVPFELLEEERPALRPLPVAGAAYAEADAKVTKTSLISWGGNQYSVPHQLARSRVKLHVYEDRLEVFHGNSHVASLPRCYEKGQRIIRDEHYVGRRTGHKLPSLQLRFEALGPIAPTYLRGLANSGSGSFRDQVEAILALCDEYGPEAVYAAMERAAQFNNYSYRAIRRILDLQERAPEALPQAPVEALPLTVAVPAVAVEQRSLDYYAKVVQG